MSQSLRFIACALVTFVVFTRANSPFATAEGAPEKVLSALIVFDHDGKTTALRVEGERQLAILEAYFPNYRLQPESEEAGGWDAKYEVIFNFKHGKSYRVLVAPNSRFWTMGRGDFELRGYFSDFVAALLKTKSPRGRPTLE